MHGQTNMKLRIHISLNPSVITAAKILTSTKLQYRTGKKCLMNVKNAFLITSYSVGSFLLIFIGPEINATTMKSSMIFLIFQKCFCESKKIACLNITSYSLCTIIMTCERCRIWKKFMFRNEELAKVFKLF